MFPFVASIVLAVSTSASQVPADALAYRPGLPQDAVLDTAPQAMPLPPATVVRKTSYFGTVTIDHRAHLARRARCVSCHGEGPVEKLAFTPKLAHDRCIGCHREERAGPTSCRDCHVKPPETLVAQGAGDAPAKPPVVHVAGETPAGPAPAAPAQVAAEAPGAAVVAQASPRAARRAYREEQREMRHVMEVGFTAASASVGPSFRIVARQDGLMFTQSIERTYDGETHTLGLLGGGVSRMLDSRWRGEALAVAGFDAVARPDVRFTPALGARIGIGYLPRRWRFDSIQVSVTAVRDLIGPDEGDRSGATTVMTTIGTGFTLARR